MKNKDVIDYGVSFRLERKDYDKITKICKEQKISISQYFRYLAKLGIDLYDRMKSIDENE